MQNIVIDMCEKFRNDQFRNVRESDNNNNNNNNNNNTTRKGLWQYVALNVLYYWTTIESVKFVKPLSQRR